MNPTLAITTGDPAGIGPEIAVKCLSNLDIVSTCRAVVIADAGQIRRTAAALELSLPQSLEIWDGRSRLEGCGPYILDLDNVAANLTMGEPTPESGQAAMDGIRRATALALDKRVDGIVTGPINKRALHLAGFEGTGHTEILAKLTDATQVGMMFITPTFKVILLSGHLSLRKSLESIKRESLAQVVRFASREYERLFGNRPKIGVAGLNPHAGEDSLFGDEEKNEIEPAVSICHEEGFDVHGPYAADSIFVRASRGEFDLVVALYHDQGMAPVKTVSFGQSVGLTVGLPFLRTTVDHGTAYDIVGQGIADPSSLQSAIALAVQLTAAQKMAA